MSNKHYIPRAVFDTLEEIQIQYKAIHASDKPHQIIRQWLKRCLNETELPAFSANDYQCVLDFLYSYRGSQDTFTSYRRDMERFIQWSWFVRKQSILEHKRQDIEAFVEFCIKPYKRWVGLKTVARFKLKEGLKIPNKEWRPFDVHISKADRKAGQTPTKENYRFSQSALKVMFGILSSFYKYQLQEDRIQYNPIALIRQKSKFIQKDSSEIVIRRLSEKQWETVLRITREKADNDVVYERTLFVLSCLYGMYLRISELVFTPRWAPKMGDFFKDPYGNWWFKTVGKGNKHRQIAVSNAMLNALKRYRVNYLELPALPLLHEKTPLVTFVKNKNRAITSMKPIRNLVQQCFDEAADYLQQQGDSHEAHLLRTATVHWLRHTGISDDVKQRPREHVRDDAGHSSGAITDRYIDVGLKERAESAKDKKIL